MTKASPAARIPVAVKTRRLGTVGREALRSALLAHLETFFDRAVKGMISRAHEAYVPAVVGGLTPRISAAAAKAGRRYRLTHQTVKDSSTTHSEP